MNLLYMYLTKTNIKKVNYIIIIIIVVNVDIKVIRSIFYNISMVMVSV